MIICDTYSGDLNPDFSDEYVFMDFHEITAASRIRHLGITLTGQELEGEYYGEYSIGKWISFS